MTYPSANNYFEKSRFHVGGFWIKIFKQDNSELDLNKNSSDI